MAHKHPTISKRLGVDIKKTVPLRTPEFFFQWASLASEFAEGSELFACCHSRRLKVRRLDAQNLFYRLRVEDRGELPHYVHYRQGRQPDKVCDCPVVCADENAALFAQERVRDLLSHNGAHDAFAHLFRVVLFSAQRHQLCDGEQNEVHRPRHVEIVNVRRRCAACLACV